MTEILRFDNVSRSFGSKRVVDSLSLTIGRGEVALLCGPSGCGKTTILRLAAGLIAPDRGRVRRAAGRFAYAFQEPRLLPWRTVERQLALSIHADGRAANRAGIRRLLDELGLDGAGSLYPRQLSGGMAQRVNLARALSTPVPLMLLDEPFTGCDDELARRILKLLIRFREEHACTLVIATHQPGPFEELAPRTFTFDGTGRFTESTSHTLSQEDLFDDRT